MNAEFASFYIPRRMTELGHADNYIVRFRHLFVKPSEKLTINADNEIYLLLDDIAEVSVDSEMGLYDLTELGLNEQCHEHTGTINIVNGAKDYAHLKFIQVVPKNKN